MDLTLHAFSSLTVIRTVSLTLMGFGSVGIIACFFLEDIAPKMNKKIEVFLENDVEAYMNRYH
jgi:hypothetical protein